MPRDEPLDEPTEEDVRVAATAVLARRVTAVTTIPEGVNALYRIELADGARAVLKAPTIATDEEFLVEPALLSRIDRETAVPVPEVFATVEVDEGPLGVAYYVMEFLDGRRIMDVVDLSSATRERLVRAAGAHLGAIHDVRVTGDYGHLHAVDGDLVVKHPFESWGALFDDLVSDVTAGLLGEGPLTDAEPRFADLEPTVRETLAEVPTTVVGSSPPPAIVIGDYRPANLVLASGDDADSIVRGVLDVGGLVGDGLLDVAMTEDALIDAPLGGTAGTGSLRNAFRTAYAERRGTDRRSLFDGRYPGYRLYARSERLAAFDYTSRFARETDPDAVARRWRSFVTERAAEVRERRD